MKWSHKIVIFLVVSTLAAVQYYRLNGNTVLTAVNPDEYAFVATSDRIDRGKSTSKLSIEDGLYTLTCELVKSEYPWPYCGLSIHINPDPSIGLDLSRYHTFRVNIDYITDEKSSGRLRTYLRNYNPAYSTLDDEYTHKYNGMEFSPGVSQGVLEIPIANLQVMTWWLADNDIAMEYSAPEYSNVNKVEFATGSGAKLGTHKIIIRSIEFEGSYIAADNFFLLLLGVWVSTGVIFIIVELNRSRKAVAKAERRHLHLKHVNQVLREQNFEYSELAHRDELTGTLNRHAVRDWLKLQAQQVKAGQGQLVMLYFDIDYFKQINDKYGHQMGDDILREFSMVMGSGINQTDKLVRWGGEEFIIFCPETSLSEGQNKAERIRHLVAQHLWVHGDSMTCSVGVAAMRHERVTETIARADEALYQAKHLGRNKVVTSY
ncbi:GGDEF domain-containing protein [Vibrio sp. 99-70-13A1]|uniref:diguanylate cyclase n=1 Tax=Vibrio sp. 99-70-13A1 TaxID=2607601 RepID=UPI001493A093|nr:GGDEF domain-containing protein [Vibrio sp. 99-70-13A1]